LSVSLRFVRRFIYRNHAAAMQSPPASAPPALFVR
jgi:hypothetical protein